MFIHSLSEIPMLWMNSTWVSKRVGFQKSDNLQYDTLGRFNQEGKVSRTLEIWYVYGAAEKSGKNLRAAENI